MADLDAARDLCAFIDASPSPYHAVATVAARLAAAGFEEADEAAALPGPGAHHVARGGSLVAWRAPARPRAFRVVGAHTDSPNLRVKPRPDLTRSGLHQLGVEVYGGALLNSWLDRDLGLSGRVALARPGHRGDPGGGGASGEVGAGTAAGGVRLVRIDRPLLRIPQLAIHLDREVNERGLVLNRQQHLAPLWAVDSVDSVGGDGSGGGDREAGRGSSGADFTDVLAAELGVAAADIVAWDVMLHPLEPARLVGLREEFVSAARIDNQLSCWAGTTALGAATAARGQAQVLVLFDHEEVGSASDRGAAGAFLGSVLERVAAACGLDRAAFLGALSASTCVSADCAHATNPNYADRHEPGHTIALNGGPVLKVNANLRYATEAPTAAVWLDACRRADVPVQWFVNRTDLACGSTIGPLTAAALGLPTVDVGAPQLAMHSARELCGSADPALLARALTCFYEG